MDRRALFRKKLKRSSLSERRMEFADEQRVAGEEMIAHEQKKHSYFSTQRMHAGLWYSCFCG